MQKTFGLTIALLLPAIFGSAQNSKNRAEGTSKKEPCEVAKTQLELNECYGERFRKSDAHLNKIYASLLKQLGSGTAVQKPKMAEKAWIQYRDLHCEAARSEFEGGSISSMVWAQCMAATANHRIEELKGAYETGERKLE